ncbi:MAG: DNA/RNA non-specific endonuclease [Lachnospiraceae bacterium]
MKKNKQLLISLILILCFIFTGCGQKTSETTPESNQIESNSSSTQESESDTESPSDETEEVSQTIDISSIPEFSGDAYVVINDNNPFFTDSDLTAESFEQYSALDSLGRCGIAYASVGQDIMPTEERGSIGKVKPSGWQTMKYDSVDGKYLYNRCHLIGYQLTGENANESNLITGTRYLNTQGMLPFENMIADYVKETNNHVLYRVTSIFEGDNLVASGVQMEAMSVEDDGEGILFNVYAYNNQPGIVIDYINGNSYEGDEANDQVETTTEEPNVTEETEQEQSTENSDTTESASYVLNTNTHKSHTPNCSSVATIKDSNRQDYAGRRDELISQGYEPCKRCNP